MKQAAVLSWSRTRNLANSSPVFEHGGLTTSMFQFIPGNFVGVEWNDFWGDFFFKEVA